MNNRTIKSELLINGGGSVKPTTLASRELYVTEDGLLVVGRPESEGKEPVSNADVIGIRVASASKADSADSANTAINSTYAERIDVSIDGDDRYKVLVGRQNGTYKFEVGVVKYYFTDRYFDFNNQVSLRKAHSVNTSYLSVASYGTVEPATFFSNKGITPQAGQIYFKYS